jgi:peroxiredoxin
VALTTSDAVRVSLRHHVSGLVVLYFTPGEKEGAAWVDGIPTRDAAQHRGYVKRGSALDGFNARVFCISSEPREHLQRIASYLEVRHITFSDPELVVAQSIGLPTVEDGGVSRYRRVVLVAKDGLIERTFGPLPDSDAAGSAHQVLTWLQATR